MSGFITQLGTLIGVVVGVVATFFATTLTARSQWNREQRARIEDRKLDAYIAYAAGGHATSVGEFLLGSKRT